MSIMFSSIQDFTTNFISLLPKRIQSNQKARGDPGFLMVVVIASLLIIFVPFDLTQLLLMAVGAAMTLLLKVTLPPRKPVKKLGKDGSSSQTKRTPSPNGQQVSRRNRVQNGDLDIWQASSTPVPQRSFVAEQFKSQVEELISQLAPTPHTEALVEEIAKQAKGAMARRFPGAQVVGIACGDASRRNAFSVAVPEVHLVATIPPDKVPMYARSSRVPLDARKSQKFALRVCTDLLVDKGGFKFRRSAFRGLEPTVTLISPDMPGQEGVAVELSVNSVVPLHNAALLARCGQLEARAKALVLLVRRWAKDRGVCYAAKGHLSPYAWTLLVIYYLQVGIEEGPLLPALGNLRDLADQSQLADWTPVRRPQVTVAELFQGFVHFYVRLDWRKEAVSVRKAWRGPADLSLPLHVLEACRGGGTDVAPSIEDPFEPSRNLGTSMSTRGLLRLREELARAARLLDQGESTSLAKLLEPWHPETSPDTSPGQSSEGSKSEDSDDR